MWEVACILLVAGCPAHCIPVLVACTWFVGCRPGFGDSVPTREAAFAVRAASVLVDDVSGYVVVCDSLRLFVCVTGVRV